MANRKISELPEKTTPDANDIIPVVDASASPIATKRITIGALVEFVKSQVATLDPDTGQLEESQLPAKAITETYSVASEAAMLALTAQIGDIAIRTDLNKTYILAQANPAVLTSWLEVLTTGGNLTELSDVSAGDETERNTLIFNPETGLWEATGVDTLLDGGGF